MGDKGQSAPLAGVSFCQENEHDWREQSTVWPPIFKYSVCRKCWMLLIGEVMWLPAMHVHDTIRYQALDNEGSWISVDAALIEKVAGGK